MYYFVILCFAPSIDLVCGIAKINFAHCKNEQNHDGRKKRPLPIGRRLKPEILPNKMASQFVRQSITTDKKWSKRSRDMRNYFFYLNCFIENICQSLGTMWVFFPYEKLSIHRCGLYAPNVTEGQEVSHEEREEFGDRRPK